jgi:hypothetical protein
MDNDEIRFYRLANQAIQAGVLTITERDTISGRGTRKAAYWGRHLRDLASYLLKKIGDQPDLDGISQMAETILKQVTHQ